MRPIRLQLGKSFAWFNGTQFFGALNDNIFKFLTIFFLIGFFGQRSASSVPAFVGTVFVIPFLLFTPYAGTLADRISKRRIIVLAKVGEVVAMTAAYWAFYFDSPAAVYIVLFLMSAQSAFFGPSKYGIVPELVETGQLSRANSYLQALTYMAIVVGSAVAPRLAQISHEHYALASLGCVAVAVVGLMCSFGIAPTPPAGGKRRSSVFFVRDVYVSLCEIKGDRLLVFAVYASAYFLLLGAFLQMNLIPYGMQVLKWNQIESGYLFATAAVGIGVGAWLAGRLSGRSIELGIVPPAALGLATSCIAIGLLTAVEFKVLILAVTFISGVSAGMFLVPMNAFIQFESPLQIRGGVIAASGFLGWLGVLVAAGLLFVLSSVFLLSAAQSFFVIGVLALGLAAASIKVLPDFLLRLFVVAVTRLLYRVRSIGEDRLPEAGGFLLVPNHVSWADSAFLFAGQRRRIRFLIDRTIYNSWWLKPFCRIMRAIPIAATDPPRKMLEALHEARRAMDAGEIVCVFAEGGTTRTGMLGPFRSGFEKIMKQGDHPIVPAYIGGLWGSVFSYYNGRLFAKPPRRFRPPVAVLFGEPMPAGSTALEVRRAVMELSCDYFNSFKPKRRSLGEGFVRSARKHWSRPCIADSTGRRLSFGRTLTAAVALADVLNEMAASTPNVGVLLPPSCAGALANLALTLSGRVPVNLSYVVSREARAYAIRKSRIATVISSRQFMQKAHIDEDMPGLVFVEDLLGRIDRPRQRRAYLKARFMPRRRLAHARGFGADDVATILFSSGSTGLPKGVLLSHHNIISNIEAALMVFKVYPTDVICAGLPFFHSFGLTITLWLPLLAGVAATYVPNPLDGRLMAEQVRQEKATLLFSTPTFLMTYVRRAEPEDFATLRMVIVGAEKLRRRLAEAFEKKFGVRPYEGYGVTEMSPLISLNVPDRGVRGIVQVGNKPGTAGHPFPGVAVRVVNPVNSRDVGVNESGLLLVKGPNVMLGYLDEPGLTAEAFQDGWYNTGDVVTIDEDGFITITDRLARFSKIGGEMVPHLKVEEVLLRGLHTHEHVVAVTSVPDEKKGEQLAVIYVEGACEPERLRQIIAESDLPNMYRPRPENYVKVKSIPILGSGKLDITGLRGMAREALLARGGAESQHDLRAEIPDA